jgi:hypothetical protein
VPPANATAFLRQLPVWLEGVVPTRLLYSAERGDAGFNGAAFHAAVDGVGPTLSLIHFEEKYGRKAKYVLGGYTATPWEGGAWHGVPCVGVHFLFSVCGAGGDVVRFGLKPGKEGVLVCSANRGPYFANGLAVWGPSAEEAFNSGYCTIGTARSRYDGPKIDIPFGLTPLGVDVYLCE